MTDVERTLQSGARHALLIPDVLVQQAKLRGSQPYLTAIHGSELETIGFAELNASSARLAAWLQRRFGVGAGSIVALCPRNCMRSALAIFALVRLGACTLILNPGDPPLRHTQLMEATQPCLRLRPPELDVFGASESEVIPDPRYLDDSTVEDPMVGAASDIFLIGTSGSTAASKIVRQTHGNAASNAADVAAHHRMMPGEIFLGCLPICHVNGLHFTLMASLVAGCHAILLPRFDPISYQHSLALVRPRIASVVPSILDALSALWRGPALPSSFAYFVSAAAPLTAETAGLVRKTTGAKIIQGYGLTETTNFSCSLPPDITPDEYESMVLGARIPSIGCAVSNEIAVQGSNGELCADHVVGEIVMRGPNVMAGYWRNDAATEGAFRGGWFHSGDLGYGVRSSSGARFFVLTGRIKNIAKVGGESVSLEEMERSVRALPLVIDAACAIQANRSKGEAIVLAIVAPETLADSAVLAHLGQTFSRNVLPHRIMRVREIPRTATGKIIRPRLIAELGIGPG